MEQALSVYTPRALYALITIINKIEGLNISSISQKYLAALLLHSFDHGNAMWRVSGSKERRHQLSIPRHFRENNIWMSLEQGIDLWSHSFDRTIDSVVPVTIWPDVPPNSGGICIYEGKLVSLVNSINKSENRCGLRIFTTSQPGILDFICTLDWLVMGSRCSRVI